MIDRILAMLVAMLIIMGISVFVMMDWSMVNPENWSTAYRAIVAAVLTFVFLYDRG